MGEAKDDSIASVNSNGELSTHSVGSVTITATSKYDSSKSGSATIEIIDAGLHPELVTEYEYEYSKSWPGEEVDTFAGMSVVSHEDSNGFYYAETKETVIDLSDIGWGIFRIPGYFEVFCEATEANYYGYQYALEDEGYFYYTRYDSSGDASDCFLDATQTLDVEFSVVSLDEAGKEQLVGFTFYHALDQFESAEETTDSAWNETVSEYLTELGFEVPFVKLGASYTAEYSEDYGILYIYDYSVDFHKLDAYGEVLAEAGFNPELREDGVAYVKSLDAYTNEVIHIYFDSYGNNIEVSKELVELDYYPENEINTFVGNHGSVFTVPGYTPAEGNYFTYELSQVEPKEGLVFDAAIASIYGASEEELLAFPGAFDGYELVESKVHANGMTYAVLQKGKVIVTLVIEFEAHQASAAELAAFVELYAPYASLTEEDIEAMSDDEYAEYLAFFEDHYYEIYYYEMYEGKTTIAFDYSIVESGYVMVYVDDHYIEEPGVFIYDDEATVAPGEELELKPQFYEMEPVELSYASSDESVATVSSEGVVTGVLEGDATITVSGMNGEEPISDSIVIHVAKSGSAIQAYVDAANEIFAELGAEEELVLPDPQATYVWEDYCGWDSDKNVYYFDFNSALTPSQYIDMLSEDYEVGVDEEGDPIATNGVYVVGAYTYEDDEMIVYVYLYEETPVVEGSTLTYSEVYSADTELTFDEFSNGIVVEYSKGDGTNAPKYYTNGTAARFYAKNTITVSAPEGEVLSSISFEATQLTASLSVSSGSVSGLEDGVVTWVAPEGGVESVTFTLGASGQFRVTSVTVELGE